MNCPGRNCCSEGRCCRFEGLAGWLVVEVQVMMIGICSTGGWQGVFASWGFLSGCYWEGSSIGSI